ncbi:DUF1882 domain-containing protein [Campylobacter troglodytis]|uniref:DUF1882 domain-containing protein n=1 Tax=Campylobacter troglodytis TaxID=654363 RepID=UPI00115B49C8|nr:DUF1882 domain-containing protein [Campylobacter troglodytis]TQR61145.1 DUF1882 domain-containing protein [Campylobacter troglodytis]
MIPSNELALIKMVSDHYYIKKDKIVNKFTYRGRYFFDRFERVSATLNSMLIRDHFDRKIIIAHDLLGRNGIVENIVFDYNGFNADRFWHRAQLVLREEGFMNFTAYKTKTRGHLHLYIHKGHTTFNEGCQLASKLSMLFASKMPVEWRAFPTINLPKEYNIMALPYEVFKKERGSAWSKHM